MLVNQFMSVIISNDSETDIGESHAAVDLECFGTFYQLETVPMMFLMKCFTAPSRNFGVMKT